MSDQGCLWFLRSVVRFWREEWGPRAHESEPFSISKTDSQIIVNLVVDEQKRQIVIQDVTDLRSNRQSGIKLVVGFSQAFSMLIDKDLNEMAF